MQSRQGFTIVELLIVIVVIGILATITIVAFNGVQNRANDTAVASDLTSLAKKLKLYNAEGSGFPAWNQLNLITDFKVSQGSYDVSNSAMLYCVNDAQTAFAVIGKSKSGKAFYVTDSLTAAQYATGFPNSGSVLCPPLVGGGTVNWAWIHDFGRTPKWLSSVA